MSLRQTVRTLYESDTRQGRVFRIALLVFDIATVAYFLFTATSEIDATLIAIDMAIGAVVLLDLAARFWISDRRWRFAFSISTVADILVILSLAAPLVAQTNLGFLRVLRLLRLFRTFRIAERADKAFEMVAINTRVAKAALDLSVFIFVVTSIVYVLERQQNENITGYVDALYFTVTTLTTTGFGDIVLQDRSGRIVTILIMVFGIGFFLKLLQAIYRPDKVEHECSQCGLELHDHDASHCKHCGNTIKIETEGET